MLEVVRRMRAVYIDVFRASGNGNGPRDAERDLTMWGQQIRGVFDKQNLHLTTPPHGPDVKHVIDVIQQLGTTIDRLRRLIGQQGDAVVELRAGSSEVRSGLSALEHAVGGASPAAPLLAPAATPTATQKASVN